MSPYVFRIILRDLLISFLFFDMLKWKVAFFCKIKCNFPEKLKKFAFTPTNDNNQPVNMSKLLISYLFLGCHNNNGFNITSSG